MDNQSHLTFGQRIEPDDIIAFSSLMACLLLVGLGHNSFLGSVITTIVGFYFGRKTIINNEQQRDSEN